MKRQIPRGEEDLTCPFHKQAMCDVCHKCPLWIQIRGKNPQSTEEIDQWGCSITWIPLLLIETAQQVRQGAAATESFRNEWVKSLDQALALAPPARPGLIYGKKMGE